MIKTFLTAAKATQLFPFSPSHLSYIRDSCDVQMRPKQNMSPNVANLFFFSSLHGQINLPAKVFHKHTHTHNSISLLHLLVFFAFSSFTFSFSTTKLLQLLYCTTWYITHTQHIQTQAQTLKKKKELYSSLSRWWWWWEKKRKTSKLVSDKLTVQLTD